MRALALLCPCSVAQYLGKLWEFQGSKNRLKAWGVFLEEEAVGDVFFLFCPVCTVCPKEQLMPNVTPADKSNAGSYLKRLMFHFCPAVTGHFTFLAWIPGS